MHLHWQRKPAATFMRASGLRTKLTGHTEQCYVQHPSKAATSDELLNNVLTLCSLLWVSLLLRLSAERPEPRTDLPDHSPAGHLRLRRGRNRRCCATSIWPQRQGLHDRPRDGSVRVKGTRNTRMMPQANVHRRTCRPRGIACRRMAALVHSMGLAWSYASRMSGLLLGNLTVL